MVDIVDRKTRSRMMSGIRGRDTKPELATRKALHAAGFRYRLHSSSLPGRPDIALARLRCAIFVHGCFWHRHSNCRFAYTPRSNTAFWKKKFSQNMARDKAVRRELKRKGWRTYIIWECQVHDRGLKRLVKSLPRRRSS